MDARFCAIPGHFLQPHAAVSDNVRADFWIDWRTAQHSLLAAIHFVPDVFRRGVVHLSHWHSAFLPARRALDGHSGWFLRLLLFRLARISDRQCLGAALASLHPGANERRVEHSLRACCRSSSRALLRRVAEIDAVLAVNPGGCFTCAIACWPRETRPILDSSRA